MVLSLSFRQPLLLTGNTFVLIFIVSLQGRVTFAELAGASMVAGAAVVAITALGLAERLAHLIPEPVVVGLLAGSTLPFVAGNFTVMGSEPAVIGAAFLAFVLGKKYLDNRVPSIFFIVLQSNVPALIFLRGQQYRPPARLLDYVSGLGTMAASFLGPSGLSLSLPATAMVAGPDAGPHRYRHRAVVVAGAIFLAMTPCGVRGGRRRGPSAGAVGGNRRPCRDRRAGHGLDADHQRTIDTGAVGGFRGSGLGPYDARPGPVFLVVGVWCRGVLDS